MNLSWVSHILLWGNENAAPVWLGHDAEAAVWRLHSASSAAQPWSSRLIVLCCSFQIQAWKLLQHAASLRPEQGFFQFNVLFILRHSALPVLRSFIHPLTCGGTTLRWEMTKGSNLLIILKQLLIPKYVVMRGLQSELRHGRLQTGLTHSPTLITPLVSVAMFSSMWNIILKLIPYSFFLWAMRYTEECFDFHDCSQTEIANIQHLVHIPVCLNFNCPKMYFHKPFLFPKKLFGTQM